MVDVTVAPSEIPRTGPFDKLLRQAQDAVRASGSVRLPGESDSGIRVVQPEVMDVR